LACIGRIRIPQYRDPGQESGPSSLSTSSIAPDVKRRIRPSSCWLMSHPREELVVRMAGLRVTLEERANL
jgi:hypothetical protein